MSAPLDLVAAARPASTEPPPPLGPLIRVLVLDDSAVVRVALSSVLSRARGFDVELAGDPPSALRKLKHRRPDVIVLDLHFPKLAGLSFLKEVMAHDPIPVVVCSSPTGEGTDLGMRALLQGAVDVIAKPRLGAPDAFHDSAGVMIDAVRAAAQARVGRSATWHDEQPAPAELGPPARTWFPNDGSRALIAIGASTGGTDAIYEVLRELPVSCAPVVVTQHLPAAFTDAFARRLDLVCAIDVREARDGELLRRGSAVIAPGDCHLVVERRGRGYVTRVVDGPLVSRHRPSVDVLFRSVAQNAGSCAVAALLTGMGEDGAQGMLELGHLGAHTIAQDEATSVVFGMPRAAIALGAASQVLPLHQIAGALARQASLVA